LPLRLSPDTGLGSALDAHYTVTICMLNPGGQDVHTRSANGVAGGGCGTIGTTIPVGIEFDQAS
jgi:hypothetical protein